MNIKKKMLVMVLLALSLAAAPAMVNGQAQKGKTVKKSGSQTVNPKDPVLNFDHAWKTLDRNYGQFLVKRVDWDAIYRVYRPMVTSATTDQELWDILLAMMGHLNDGHLALADGKRRIGGGRNNGSFTNDEFSLDLVKSKYLQGKFTEALGGSFISGWLAEGVGYLYIGDLKDGLEPITKTIDAVMAEFAKARVMIVDVRNNPGGTSRSVEIVAGRFADRRRHFITARTRYGPKHDDFWPWEFRNIEPGGPLQFTGPTVLLTDHISGSAAEGFTLAMRVLPHVTVVGDTTEGGLSSQFPERMPNGWTLWVAFKEVRDHDGVCWDGVGIPPDLRVINTAADIAAGRDQILDFAMKYLEKGAPALQDEAKSLVDIKKSLVDEYVQLVKDKGYEAAVAMLNRERATKSGIYYFVPDEVMQQAGPLLGRRQYAEAIGLLRASREDFPKLADTYAMLAQCLSRFRRYPGRRGDHERGRNGRADVLLGTAADRAGQAGAAQGQAGFGRRTFRQGPGRGRHPGRRKETERTFKKAPGRAGVRRRRLQRSRLQVCRGKPTRVGSLCVRKEHPALSRFMECLGQPRRNSGQGGS